MKAYFTSLPMAYRRIVWICICIFWGSTRLSAQDMSRLSARKFVRQVLQIYSPLHHEMLERYYKIPNKLELPNIVMQIGRPIDYIYYIADTSRKELILHSLPSAIHETAHNFGQRMAYYYLYEHRIPYNNVEDNYFAYWLDNRELVLINQPRTFPANEVAPFIDKKLRGERFSLMISNQNKSLLPQKNGAYGLLEEWYAYYHECLMAFNLRRIYEREVFMNDIRNWEDFFATYYESHTAYWEIKYYLLKYLEYSENVHPEIFKKITNDAQFRKVFARLDEQHQSLMLQFEKYKTSVFDLVGRLGYQVREQVIEGQDLLFIGDVGLMTYQNTEKEYRKALQDKALLEIERLLKK